MGILTLKFSIFIVKNKNIYESNINGQRTVTRVMSIGDKNVRKIIYNIYIKNLYTITKNGEDYCHFKKR